MDMPSIDEELSMLNEPILPGTANLVAGQRVVLDGSQSVYVVPSNQTRC
jgi:hypothetical protein